MQGQGQISCIIVGETPDIQFLGWRLSLGSAFIVLVSQYVSSDGLVGWKSSRLGANFYTPNVFAKEVGELSPKLLNPDNGKCKYPIDVIIISGISIGQFAENCKAVSRFANPQTTVLVNASFGCELEEVALNVFDKNCKCVMSIACDIECRQLSLGSYALVNDNNCKVYLGLTYTSQNDSDKALLSKNEASVREELDIQTDTNTNKLIKQLTVTKWVKVQSYKNPQEMAVKIWEMIIPKISLNILSVIYEQFDYDTLLKNKSNEIVFRDLVKELFDICYAQCNAKVETFMSETNTSISSNKSTGAIDFNKIVDHCKSKRKELIKTTVNEYPEYLSLPFESYCFYHRFEYPAHILLYQPILLAKKYNAQCSNLNFLYGFYSRLLSLSGLSIYGGRSESHISVFDKRVAEASNNSNNSGNGHKRKTKKSSNRKKDKSKQVKKEKNQALVKVAKPHPLWSGCRSNNELGLWAVAPPSGNELLLPDDLGNLYLAAENLNGPSSASVLSRSSNGNNGYSIGKPKSMDSDDHYSTAESNDGGVVVGIDSDDERLKTRNSGRNSGSGGKRGGYLDGSSGSMDVDDDEAETGSYYDQRAASTGTPSVNDSDDDYEEDDDDDYDYQEDDDDALEIKMSSRSGKFKNRELINKIRKKKGGALENMGVIAVPHFIKRFSPKTPNNSNTSLAVFDPATANDPSHAIKRPYTTTSLELQLRTGEHLIAKEYDDLHQQLTGPETDPSQVRQAHDNRRRTFANVEKQFWKLQRRHNMYNRNISRPKTGPYEDLLDHMDILRRSNANEILDFTTSRYGNAESCAKMQNDKNLILSLHESKLRASNKNKRKLRIGASSTS
ncbi:ZYRO0F03410p [Zygosaccharomyces rouxii]|uniref:ZYRO0F03410p n=1 Tax=Zygosaccharomyces rouxii (strain ATCC 2623 / CBS 732 / NBRC 1130 / NCYC 568 / NRRL Y-229) TaxID=559307 RepID=C5DXA2_ZYGRC|nr:uncharacterized protein ZYRO0F03410g [Zygosaccharomyces rouxii]KAH9199177.1 hypothetical protein LQ764DRAFT_126882 [Zygosaccharomyces rouxii]CAR28413.1 ZYRO0F03410p [Zygosaccharomyces rouxii]